MTTPAQGTEEIQDAGHVDVLIVGAGVSGIGAAHHLRERFPDRTFVILDAQDNRGGTWWTHRYPGVRSDSDLFTYGYRFKPWRGPSIAAGEEILGYLDEVIDEDDLSQYIRYQHRVTAASWSTEDRRWTVEVTRGDTGERLRFTTDFLWMCQGYYNHAKPYRPEWEGMDRFQGVLVHPQKWPEDLDLAGKRVVVIGSGATAATLIPAIAENAAHVTMLQRSPTYFFARPTTHELAVTLRAAGHPARSGRTRSCAASTSRRSTGWPGRRSRRPTSCTRSSSSPCARCCPRASTSTSTSPPATARGSSASPSSRTAICSPRCARARPRSSPTPSRRSPSTGIKVGSGEEIPADVVVTATGFNLSVFGDVAFTVDDEPVDFTERVTWRGIMISGVPNMAYVFGYFRHSWTLRVDLVGDLVCRLLEHMQEQGRHDGRPDAARRRTRTCRCGRGPTRRTSTPATSCARSTSCSSRATASRGRTCWSTSEEREILPKADLDDGTLVYG